MTQKSDGGAGDEVDTLSPLLDYAEAGRYLRKGASFVRKEVYAGRLAISRIGRTPYVTKGELDRYVGEQQETGADAQRPEMTPPRFRNPKSKNRAR